MIRAIRYHDTAAFKECGTPGAVYFDVMQHPVAMWFICPCGCGNRARIAVAKDTKPATSPSWKWNGSLNDPTLEPSVRQLVCGWHGYLRDGYWESC